MGLDLVVYKNIKNLELLYGSSQVKIDPDTGEVYFDDPIIYKYYESGYFEAVSERVGNIAEIASLGEEIRALLGSQSAILKYVLSEEIGCGDVLRKEEQQFLDDDIIKLQFLEISQSLADFIEKLTRLIQEARKQNNPVIFT